MVESQPSKLLVAGSIPVSRSNLRSLDWSRASILSPAYTPQEFAAAGLPAVARSAKADVAQLAEHVLGKDEVTGSIPVMGSVSLRPARKCKLTR